jgi:hypothetical protein
VILVGARPDAAQELGGRAVLLVGPDGTRYLLWSGHRYPIREPTFVLPALGFSASEGVAVGDAWLAPVPLGATLGPIDVPGAGAGLPRFPRAKVGQLVRVAAADGTGRVYLVRPEGLQELTELQQALVRTSGAVIIAVEPTDLAGTTIVAPMTLPGFAAPAEVPAFARPSTEDALVCAVMIADHVDIILNGHLPMRAASVVARRVSGGDGVPLADEVLVEPGHAVLARSLAGPQATGGPLLLVTDLGIRHSCGSAEVPGMLGFPSGSTPVPLPAALLARVTEGIALDPAKARLALPGS